MARVTVFDCLDQIPNHFELTMVAAKRARQLTRGAEAKLPWGTHKSTVLALREIAAGHVSPMILKEIDLPHVVQPRVELNSIDPLLDA